MLAGLVVHKDATAAAATFKAMAQRVGGEGGASLFAGDAPGGDLAAWRFDQASSGAVGRGGRACAGCRGPRTLQSSAARSFSCA